MAVKTEIFHDNFQNYKKYNIACCSISQLLCYDCPLYDASNNKCRPWSDEEVVEAVRTLNREQEG